MIENLYRETNLIENKTNQIVCVDFLFSKWWWLLLSAQEENGLEAVQDPYNFSLHQRQRMNPWAAGDL